MGRKRLEVEIPDGTRLGFAQDSEGGMRGLLFDKETNRLVGHAELFEYDDDDDWSSSTACDHDDPHRDDENDVDVEAIAGALALVFLGIEAAAPHIREWWKNRMAPALKSTPERVKSKLKRARSSKKTDDGVSTADIVTPDSPEASDRSIEELVSPDRLGPIMSSAEAQQRLAYAVGAMAFAREQMKLLHNARITGDNDPLKLANTLNELSPESLEDAIHLMLEADPSMLSGIRSLKSLSSARDGRMAVPARRCISQGSCSRPLQGVAVPRGSWRLRMRRPEWRDPRGSQVVCRRPTEWRSRCSPGRGRRQSVNIGAL